jgi:hypothetical protein
MAMVEVDDAVKPAPPQIVEPVPEEQQLVHLNETKAQAFLSTSTSNDDRLKGVRNRTLTLIEREDNTRSWKNFLVYFSHSTTMPCPPRGWGYILIGC